LQVSAQTRSDAIAAAIITKETGISDPEKLTKAAEARAAPVWERSDRNGGSSACMWCATAFGMTVWRYHCSCCGWVVCGECSPKATQLSQWLDPEKPHEIQVGFPSFSAFFNRKMQKLPLFSCISIRNEGKNGQGWSEQFDFSGGLVRFFLHNLHKNGLFSVCLALFSA
jgi:hypothetical protein